MAQGKPEGDGAAKALLDSLEQEIAAIRSNVARADAGRRAAAPPPAAPGRPVARVVDPRPINVNLAPALGPKPGGVRKSLSQRLAEVKPEE